VDTKRLTLIAILASAYAVLSLLPGIPMIGADGSTIDLVRMLEIGYGLVLGPVYGPITAFMGAVIGKMLTGGGFGLFFTPLAAVSAFTAAMIGRYNGKYWWASAGIILVLIGGWYVFETGRIVWYYPAMHVASLLSLVVLRGKISKWIWSEDRREKSIGLFICSFASTIAGHMLGGLIFIVLLAPEPALFITIMVVSLIERLGISLGATVFAGSLILAVERIYPELLD
jgi:hypothetical protein